MLVEGVCLLQQGFVKYLLEPGHFLRTPQSSPSQGAGPVRTGACLSVSTMTPEPQEGRVGGNG